MSYIRASSKYRYVKGENKNYAWSDGKHVVDYGSITDETLVELLYRHFKTDDAEFKDYLLFRLANRLKVKLQTEPRKKGVTVTNHIENRPPNRATANKILKRFVESAKLRKKKT